MNKADLVDRIAGACNISKAQATTAIDTTVDSVTAALRKGDRVALIGFGTFSDQDGGCRLAGTQERARLLHVLVDRELVRSGHDDGVG